MKGASRYDLDRHSHEIGITLGSISTKSIAVFIKVRRQVQVSRGALEAGEAGGERYCGAIDPSGSKVNTAII